MNILIVDDEKNIRLGLSKALSLSGYTTTLAATGLEAWQILNNKQIDLIITDLRMPEMGGFDLLQKVVSAYPMIPVIVQTGHGTIETAVQAMQKGAFDFVTKPVNLDRLDLLIKQALEHAASLRSQGAVGSAAGAVAAGGFVGTATRLSTAKAAGANGDAAAQNTDILTASPLMHDLLAKLRRVAATNASVLITGETGVGKELVVEALHQASPRAKAPLMKVHCASLSPSLLESELFGSEKGAFTGATETRKGRFERAHGGTLFLDEIGEISPEVQVKILRVLQERSFERVGGQKEIEVDIRIVAATNRDLEKEVREGRFREDLYYRLNVVHFEVPPLRERPEDIALLAQHFATLFAKENGRDFPPLGEGVLTILKAYSWPGNIRELRNAVMSAVVLADGDSLGVDDFPKAQQAYAEH